MKHFGKLLKNHIENQRLKKREVAESVGITYNYLSTIFTKETVDAQLLEKLCLATGLPTATVFDDGNIPAIKVNADNNATALFGQASVNLGANEHLYQQIINEKERYIRALEEQIQLYKSNNK